MTMVLTPRIQLGGKVGGLALLKHGKGGCLTGTLGASFLTKITPQGLITKQHVLGWPI